MTLLLRITAARWLVPLGALAAVGALMLDPGWEGSWGDTTLRATTHLLLLLPLVMVSGAVDARRLLRASAHPSAVSAAKSVSVVTAQLAAAVVVWGIGGYLVVLLVGYTVTARLNPLLSPPVPVVWIVAGIAAIVAHAGLGVLLGRLVPILLALALSALVGLVGNAVLAAQQGSIAALFSVADAAFLGGVAAPRPLVQLLQAGFFVMVAAAAVVATGILVRCTRLAVVCAGVITVLAVGAAVGLAATGGQKRQYLTDATGPRTCVQEATVCLWSDHAFLAAGYAEVGRRMLAGAPPWVPSGWTEVGLARTPGHAELYVAGNHPAVDGMATALADGVMDQLAPARDPADTRLLLAETWLVARALDDATRNEFVSTHGKPVAAILTQPPTAQWSWFMRTVTAEHR